MSIFQIWFSLAVRCLLLKWLNLILILSVSEIVYIIIQLLAISVIFIPWLPVSILRCLQRAWIQQV